MPHHGVKKHEKSCCKRKSSKKKCSCSQTSSSSRQRIKRVYIIDRGYQNGIGILSPSDRQRESQERIPVLANVYQESTLTRNILMNNDSILRNGCGSLLNSLPYQENDTYAINSGGINYFNDKSFVPQDFRKMEFIETFRSRYEASPMSVRHSKGHIPSMRIPFGFSSEYNQRVFGFSEFGSSSIRESGKSQQVQADSENLAQCSKMRDTASSTHETTRRRNSSSGQCGYNDGLDNGELSTRSESISENDESGRKASSSSLEIYFPFEKIIADDYQMRRIKRPSTPERYMLIKNSSDDEGEYVVKPLATPESETPKISQSPVAQQKNEPAEKVKNDILEEFNNSAFPKIQNELRQQNAETRQIINGLKEKIDELKASISSRQDRNNEGQEKHVQTDSVVSLAEEEMSLIPQQFCRCSETPMNEPPLRQTVDSSTQHRKNKKHSKHKKRKPKNVILLPGDLEEYTTIIKCRMPSMQENGTNEKNETDNSDESNLNIILH